MPFVIMANVLVYMNIKEIPTSNAVRNVFLILIVHTIKPVIKTSALILVTVVYVLEMQFVKLSITCLCVNVQREWLEMLSSNVIQSKVIVY